MSRLNHSFFANNVFNRLLSIFWFCLVCEGEMECVCEGVGCGVCLFIYLFCFVLFCFVLFCKILLNV